MRVTEHQVRFLSIRCSGGVAERHVSQHVGGCVKSADSRRSSSTTGAGRSRGLDRVIERFGDGYAAWVWLTTELASLDGATPLMLLWGGEVDRVAKAAEGDRQGDFA